MAVYEGVGILAGYRVITTNFMCARVRAKKHRKRRIDKKWLKRYGFKQVPLKEIYLDTNNRTIYMHPQMLAKLEEYCLRRGEGDG